MFTKFVNSYRQAISGLPREVWYLALVMFINRSGSMVLAFLTLYVNKELGYSEQLAGMVIAVFGVGSILGSLLGGWLTDCVGAIRLQAIAFVLNAVGFVALYQLTDYVAFVVTLFLMSAAGEAFRPANAAAIAEFSPPELHRRAFALNRMAINLGFTIGPAVGGLLATYSFAWLFWIDAATCLMAAAALLFLFRGRKQAVHVDAVGEIVVPTRSPWTDWNFVCFLLLTVLTFSVFFQLLSTYPLYLTDEYHLEKWHIGMLMGLNTLGVVTCEMLLVHALQNCPPLRVIAWGSFFMCQGMAMLIFGNGFWFASAAVMVWTLGEMLCMPQAMAFVAKYSGKRNRARFLGAYTTCVSASFVIGSAIGAWCYGINHHLIWYVAAIVGFVVLICTLRLGKGMERSLELDQPVENQFTATGGFPLLPVANRVLIDEKIGRQSAN